MFFIPTEFKLMPSNTYQCKYYLFKMKRRYSEDVPLWLSTTSRWCMGNGGLPHTLLTLATNGNIWSVSYSGCLMLGKLPRSSHYINSWVERTACLDTMGRKHFWLPGIKSSFLCHPANSAAVISTNIINLHNSLGEISNLGEKSCWN
jgi:hypothetical protein